MRQLPLYPTVPKPPVLLAPPRARNPKCTSCGLSDTAKNVCAGGFVTGPGGARTGGTLIILPGPLVGEDSPGAQPIYGAGGRYLQHLVGVAAPTVWTFAIRCAAPGGVPTRSDKRAKAALAGCRGYLAEELRRLRPSRVLCVGTLAATAVFGDDAPAVSQVRRGYGWLGSTPATATPVFLLDDPAAVLAHRTLRPEYEADVRWALSAEVGRDIAPPPWSATFRVVETVDDARAAAAELRATATTEAPLVFDVETASSVGLWADDFRVVSLAFTPTPGPDGSWLWPRAALDAPELRAPALELLADPSVPKGGANGKYDCNAIRSAFGVEVRGYTADTRLESRLYDPDMAADLDTMNWSVGMGGAKTEAANAVAKASKAVVKATKAAAAAAAAGQGSLFGDAHAPATVAPGARPAVLAYGLVDPTVLGRYNVRDTVGTAASVPRLRRIAAQPDRYHTGARHVWETLVRDATEVFARVESRGFLVDREALFRTADRIADRIAEEREAIAREAPGLNPDADAEVSDLLYRNMRLTTSVLTEGGALSVSYDALAENEGAHEVVPHLMRYGALTHLRRTYLDGQPAPGQRYGTTGLLRHIRPDGRIHCTYNLDGARTGRLSASDPNLQNIPRAELDPNDPDSVFGKLIKDMFVAPRGWRFLQLDYSQLELRVAAIIAADPVMAEIFRSGVDYHLRTAEMIAPVAFGVSPEAWAALDSKGRKTYRSRAKTVNFGLLYGMAAKTLAKRMGCDVPTAIRTIDAILGKMVKLAKWMEVRRREADETGIICTEWAGRQGRFRPLHRLDYRGTIAVNTPVQGTASEFCLASVVGIERALEYEGLDNDAEVIGTVHDSIVLLAREEVAAEVLGLGKMVMEGHLPDAPVRLVADAEWGDQWGSLEPVELAA